MQLFNLLNHFAAASCDKSSFAGLLPWWHYLPKTAFPPKGGCNVVEFDFLNRNSPDLALVLLAVVDDLLRIAGLVAVGFVLYGAIKLIVSQGEPEAYGNARTTILNALIGVAIASIAIGLVTFMGHKFGN